MSEEAFKGLGGSFGKGALDVGESDYRGFDEELAEGEAGDEGELDVSKLGLPERLVDTLEKRGITQLFPIQVCVFFFCTITSSLASFNIFFTCYCYCFSEVDL